MATATPGLNFPAAPPVRSSILCWVLMIPLLVFASQWGFSFEHGSLNTRVGSHEDAQNGTPVKVQSAVVYLICAAVMMPWVHAIATYFYCDWLISSLAALAFLSTLWSQFPLATLLHATFLSANIAFAFYLLDRFSTNELLQLLLMAGALAVIGSVVLIVLLPQYGLQERSSVTSGAWQGIFPQKNICGLIMTNLLLPAFFVQIRSRTWKIARAGYVASVLLLVIMCRSAGAWITCASCLLFVAAIKVLNRMPRKDIATIVFIAAGVAALVAVMVERNFAALTYAIGKDPTLTGRTTIWASVISSIRKAPLLGYGYTAFWGFLEGESANTVLVFHGPLAYAENGILELWLELGAVGVGLYLLLFVRALKDAVYCFLGKPTPAVMWYASGLFYIAASNVEAGKLLSTSDLGLILSLIAFAGLRREAQRARLKAQSETRRRSRVVYDALRLSDARC
jgi:exopolysaccharide production protein ExoQ